MEANTFGWETFSFSMEPNADTMTVTLNGQPVDPPIGLDNRYRVQQQEGVFSPEAMRGRWEDGSTLSVQLVNLGQLSDLNLQIVFTEDAIDLHGNSVVDGQEIKLHGVRVQE
jgi:hypothetical protein